MTLTPGDVERERSDAPGALFFLGALVVAAFLLFGAFAKIHMEATRQTPTWPVAPLAHGAFEAIVAIGLLVRRRDPRAWALVSLLFAFFAGVTMHRLLGGYPTCGCFGKFAVPPKITLTIDTGIVMMSAALARLAALSGFGIAWLAALMLPMAIGGSVYSLRTSDPPPKAFQGGALRDLAGPTAAPPAHEAADRGAPSGTMPIEPPSAPASDATIDVAGGALSAQQGLLLVPRAADKILAGAPGPRPVWLTRLDEAAADSGEGSARRAWLVFVYDPDCEVCKQFIPAYEQHEQVQSREAAAKLRVIMVKKSELEPFEIPDWAWPASPTVVLVRAGKVIHEWGNEKAPYPLVLQGEIDKGGSAHLDMLEKTHTPLTP